MNSTQRNDVLSSFKGEFILNRWLQQAQKTLLLLTKMLTFELKVTYFGVHASVTLALSVEFCSTFMQGV